MRQENEHNARNRGRDLEKHPSADSTRYFHQGLTFNIPFLKPIAVAFQFLDREKARLARLQEHCNEVQEIERRTPSFASSRRKISKLSALSPKKILPPPFATTSHVHSELPDPNVNSGGPTLPHVPASAFLSAFPARARDNLLMSAIAVDPNVKGRAFPPPAIPYHHHSASDGFFKKVRMQKYLKKEERGTGSYEGAMNSTRDGRESGGHDFNPPAGLPISAARVPHLRPLMASPRQVCLTLAFVFSCRALGWGSEQSVPVKTDFTPFRKYRQRRTNPTRTFRFSKVRPSTQSTPPLRTVASH